MFTVFSSVPRFWSMLQRWLHMSADRPIRLKPSRKPEFQEFNKAF